MKNNLIGLDTNIFIYFFENNPNFAPACTDMFIMLQRKAARGVTSILTLTELLSFKMHEEHVSQLMRAFFQLENLRVLDINQPIAIDAARIRREYNFRISDSIQLATAKHAKVDVFVTNDLRLTSFTEIHIEILQKNTVFN